MLRHVVVTAGSAVTELDEVRATEVHVLDGDGSPNGLHVSHEMKNIFKGELGCLLAAEFVKAGIRTTLICRDETAGRVKPSSDLKVVAFKTFGQLETALWRELEHEAPDMVLMAAAPPDYAPTQLQGKMRSDAEEISITYRRTPKLLDGIRGRVGAECFVVGFKLLVGVDDATLDQVGRAQIARAATDLCVANDLRRIKPEERLHPLRLVFATSPSETISGFKPDVAAELVARLLSLQSAH